MPDIDPIPLDGDDDAPTTPASPDPFGLDDEETGENQPKEMANPPRAPLPVEPPKPLPRLVRMTDPTPDGTPVAGRKDASSPRKSKPESDSRRAEPRQQKRSGRPIDREPPAPLPRASSSSSSSPAPSSSRKSRKRRDDDDEPREGVLEEPTPEFDTFETRQTIRNILGGGLLLTAVVALAWSLGLFRSDPRFSDFDPDDPSLAAADPVAPLPGPTTSPAGPSMPGEHEAQLALDDARAAAKRGDSEGTVQRLKLVVEGYPKTAAGKAAREALARGERGLPLFVDGPLVVAQPGEPPPPPPVPAAPPEVIAAPAATTPAAMPDTPTTPTPREIAPPPTVTPEPRRITGIERPTADIAARPLPDGFRPRPEAGVDPSGWPLEITGDRDGATLIFIPGGSFVQGRDDGPESERPAHRVRLSPYYIDQHEVTIRQYRLFALATARSMPGAPEGAGPDWPVTGVSARDALDYAQWAGKTLPTEAQWEFAARTTDGRLFPWGPRPRPARPPSAPVVGPIFSEPDDLSPFGVHDLGGNAREWTSDWYDARAYEALGATVAVDPAGPARKSRTQGLTIKGGSPTREATWRSGQMPESRSNLLGFRCVLPLSAPNAPGRPANSPRGAGVAVPF